jgi:hypothetical protein
MVGLVFSMQTTLYYNVFQVNGALTCRPSPGSSNRRQKAKVFWFFSSEKNKTLLFLKKKKQKDFIPVQLTRALQLDKQ